MALRRTLIGGTPLLSVFSLNKPRFDSGNRAKESKLREVEGRRGPGSFERVCVDFESVQE